MVAPPMSDRESMPVSGSGAGMGVGTGLFT